MNSITWTALCVSSVLLNPSKISTKWFPRTSLPTSSPSNTVPTFSALPAIPFWFRSPCNSAIATSISRPNRACTRPFSIFMAASPIPVAALSRPSRMSSPAIFRIHFSNPPWSSPPSIKSPFLLRSGLYRLDLVIKDTQRGNIGTQGVALRVPRFDEEKLDASSLILADQIELVASSQVGIGQFVLGAYKVRPRLSQEFSASENLGVYLQLYNLKLDEAIHKTKVSVAYRITRDQQEVWRAVETADHLHQGGEQLTIERFIPASTLVSGHYTIEVTAIDLLTNETVIRTAEFTVKPSPAKALVPLRPSLF